MMSSDLKQVLNVLDNTPMNRSRKFAALVISLGEFIDGYTLLIAGAAVIVLRPDFNLGPEFAGLLSASSFLGTAFGLLLFGEVADRVGRLTIFKFNMLLFILFSVLSALSTNVTEIFVFRTLVGIAIGMDIPASTGYLAEISPKKSRGGWIGSILNSTWTIGGMVSALIGIPLIPHFGPVAWRWMFGIGAIPALGIYIARRTLPESPRWLLQNGRQEEAAKALTSWGVDVKGKVLTMDKVKSSYADLFRRPYGKRTAIVGSIFFLNCLSGPIATVSTPYILRYVGLFSYQQTLLFSGIVWLTDLIGAASSFYLIDRIGRKRLTYISLIPAAVLAIIIGLFGTVNHTILLVAFFLFGFFNWVGGPSLQWTWSSELFPTSFRGRSQGFCNSLCRFAIVINAVIIPVGIATIGFRDILLLLSIPLFMYAIIVAAFKDFESAGKSLEEWSAEVSGG